MHIGPTFEFCLCAGIIAPTITEWIQNYLFLEVPSLAWIERKWERVGWRAVNTVKMKWEDTWRKERVKEKEIIFHRVIHFSFVFFFSLCKWKVKIKGKIFLWNKKSSVENLWQTVMYPLLEHLVTSGSLLRFSKWSHCLLFCNFFCLDLEPLYLVYHLVNMGKESLLVCVNQFISVNCQYMILFDISYT